MTEKTSPETAHEKFKQITTRKLVPTPANYQTIYNELAGVTVMPPFPADMLRDIALSLPANTPGQQNQRDLLEYAIDRLNWEDVKTALVAYGGFVPLASNETPSTDIPAPAAVSLGFSAPALTAEFMCIHYGHRMSFAAGEQSEIEKPGLNSCTLFLRTLVL